MREKSGSGGLRWLTACVLALAGVPMALAWHSAQVAPASTPDEDITPWINPTVIEVQMRSGTDDAALADLSKKLGFDLQWNSSVSKDETDVADLTLPAGTDPKPILEALSADSRVETADIRHLYTEPGTEARDIRDAAADTLLGTDEPGSSRWKPNDPRYNEQWNFRMVKAEEAWEVTKGKGAIVAVIDTGVAYADTKKGKRARDLATTQFVPGYDFVGHDEFPYDDQGHGSHVTGTIAQSTDNNEGVAGLAFEAKIMPLKVLDSGGSGSSANIAEAVRWAADHGANVINMSLGGPFPDKLMGAACEYARKKGVVIVCAAGNSGREGVGYPAAYKDCIAVSAVGPKGDLSFYSSWGSQVAIAAPGGDKQVGGDAGGILQNTVMRGDNGVLDDYYSFQGTSMASPHVAAVAALIVSQGVKDPADVKNILQKSAVPKGPKNKYGAGILDAAAAVKLAGNTYGDGVARFWIVVAMFGCCFWIGEIRRKSGSALGAPFWGTAALAFGLLFPDWLTGFLGQTSAFNLIGHSVLIPGALLILGAQGKTERRMIGWMALGLTLHVGWEFLRHTSPFGSEIGFWQLVPWVTANAAAGLGMLVAGLTASRD